MVALEEMAKRCVTSCNYITSVNGMLHPDRVMSEHDFLYVLEGEWEIYEDGILYRMQADDLLILKAGSHHYGENPCNPGNRHMYFHMLPTEKEQARDKKRSGEHTLPAEIERWSGEHTLPAEIEQWSEEKGLLELPTLIHCSGSPQIRRYMQDIISVYWSAGEKREEQLSLLCNLIINNLSEIAGSSAQGIAGDPLVEQVCQRLRTSPQRFFSAQEMAAEFYICPRTLNNRFQKVFGQTFSGYQMELRLRMVQQYLRCQPDATLCEAALNFGFCDEFHLSHAFKKQFGMCPSNYRAGLK